MRFAGRQFVRNCRFEYNLIRSLEIGCLKVLEYYKVLTVQDIIEKGFVMREDCRIYKHSCTTSNGIFYSYYLLGLIEGGNASVRL